MPLEDSSAIDLIFPAPDGRVLLIVTDSGASPDERRAELLHAKLAAYAAYLTSDRFRREHPGKSPADALIRVTCARAPTESMASIRSIQLPPPASASVPVEFQRFDG